MRIINIPTFQSRLFSSSFLLSFHLFSTMSDGRSGGSLMGGTDEPSVSKEEASYMEGRNSKPIEVPPAFTETLSIRVCPKQRLGITIRQSDNRVMGIHWSSPLHNKMCIGDKMLKVNDAEFNMKTLLKAATPHKTIGCSSESIEEGHTPVIMKITIERAVYSWSRLEMTTLEKLMIPKLSKAGAEPKQEEIFTGRPLKRYTVVLRRPCVPGITLASIGLSLRYDSRERVTVAAVEAGSVASAHLRPWDIIKRVNNEAVNTKTMCAFMIIKSFKESGQVILSVEVMNNTTSSRDTMEMPEDVVNICANQIGVMRSGTVKCLPPIFIVRSPTTPAASPKKNIISPGKKDTKNEKEKRITHAEGKAREEEIVSDTPEGTCLRQAKSANETSVRNENNGRDFSESDELTDISLVVEGQKLHVSKTMLAVNSPVFKAMFFGNFEEANKSEVEIKEVEHKAKWWVWNKHFDEERRERHPSDLYNKKLFAVVLANNNAKWWVWNKHFDEERRERHPSDPGYYEGMPIPYYDFDRRTFGGTATVA
ncbi:hypothetical protein PRIPAC_86187 [Pristionchus pacificus]|uniref:BTB domain-containing protein n=1 Tax=Pristionchus pacificus TaxID=54126 RepID=A0A2A6BME5_PRIPA|nr:hypothetical protein PRIPAC_86187 [Pristionchus pacificus]|eukprot:PDM66976.1 BTB domain-containing protein [Pristionchus pacificus]